MEEIQYITNNEGERVGVLLDMQTYQHLALKQAHDPDILIGLSNAELEALANSKLASSTQTHLDTLLIQNTNSQLSSEETTELDGLLAQVDYLTVLKTRARYTLHQQASLTTFA